MLTFAKRAITFPDNLAAMPFLEGEVMVGL
jgi:hypothetical protein